MEEHIRQAKIKFRYQRARAIQRGIDWELTFEQWFQWWMDTGHWDQRGKGFGKYVMSRYGDIGPYSLDNIFCQLDVENSREGAKKLKGVKKSEEFCKNLSIKLAGRPKPHQEGKLNRFHKDNLTDDLREKIKAGAIKRRKPVITPMGRFESLTIAAEAYKVDKGTIKYRMKIKPQEYYYET